MGLQETFSNQSKDCGLLWTSSHRSNRPSFLFPKCYGFFSLIPPGAQGDIHVWRSALVCVSGAFCVAKLLTVCGRGALFCGLTGFVFSVSRGFSLTRTADLIAWERWEWDWIMLGTRKVSALGDRTEMSLHPVLWAHGKQLSSGRG